MSKHGLGLVIHSFWIRAKSPMPPLFGPLNNPIDFLRVVADLGAPGGQIRIPTDANPREIRDTAMALGLHVEGIVALPRDQGDIARFEQELHQARAAGVEIARTVCLNGRRYETFTDRAGFDAFAAAARRSLQWAEPIAARERVVLAVENHKDWRTDEMLALLHQLGSDWLKVCLDTGNSVALLEDPLAVAKALAPLTVTTHLKDVALADDPLGFQLAEVPFGTGVVELPALVTLLRQARPNVRLNLEMITRDPLRVPCLTERYWSTLPPLAGQELAATLARARVRATPLPIVAPLSLEQKLARESENIVACIDAARRFIPG